MSLQWYPGHMTKARRELAERMPSQDVVVEILDARMPSASANPVITELRGATPALKILTRSDLADPAVTAAWLRSLEAAPGDTVRAFAATSTQPGETRRRFADALKRFGLASSSGRPVRALIAGVPNIGKSTLINTLMDRAVAKVSDKPAVTKIQKTVALPTGTLLTDSPGLLWPHIVDESIAFRLALGGVIPDTAIDYLTIGRFAAEYLRQHYPAEVAARFKLGPLGPTGDDVLAELGRRRGCLLPGGAIDLHKASELLVHEFRAGRVGRVSLETPPADAPAQSPA
ncbi:MAG: ribosome biogenesis GTPase YlqF [Myxococcales bacterium]|nr:ribosome biogenesis GTPase YlqF [Myxococcales bacterium]